MSRVSDYEIERYRGYKLDQWVIAGLDERNVYNYIKDNFIIRGAQYSTGRYILSPLSNPTEYIEAKAIISERNLKEHIYFNYIIVGYDSFFQDALYRNCRNRNHEEPYFNGVPSLHIEGESYDSVLCRDWPERDFLSRTRSYDFNRNPISSSELDPAFWSSTGSRPSVRTRCEELQGYRIERLVLDEYLSPVDGI